MQERPKAIIAGFGCQPPSPDYLRLLSEWDATECNEDAAAVECRLDLGKDFRRDRMA